MAVASAEETGRSHHCSRYAAKTAPPRKPLDLRVHPDQRSCTRSEELNKILATPFFREDIEEVRSGRRASARPANTPNVWPGIASPVWALLNPSQSWRIFAPLPPDQTRRSDVRARTPPTRMRLNQQACRLLSLTDVRVENSPRGTADTVEPWPVSVRHCRNAIPG